MIEELSHMSEGILTVCGGCKSIFKCCCEKALNRSVEKVFPSTGDCAELLGKNSSR